MEETGGLTGCWVDRMLQVEEGTLLRRGSGVSLFWGVNTQRQHPT